MKMLSTALIVFGLGLAGQGKGVEWPGNRCTGISLILAVHDSEAVTVFYL